MHFLLSWRSAEVAVLLQGTCHNSAICWPILSQVTLDQELTVQPSKHYLARLVKGCRLCTAPAAQGVKALLGSLATAGLRLVYQLLAGAVSMDCPGLAFPVIPSTVLVRQWLGSRG